MLAICSSERHSNALPCHGASLAIERSVIAVNTTSALNSLHNAGRLLHYFDSITPNPLLVTPNAVTVPRWGWGVHRPHKSWPGPLNLAALLTHCGQLILRKIRKLDATICQILRLNAQNSISAGAPDPAVGANSAPQTL